MRTTTEDPIKKFRFRIEVDGFARMGVHDVSGLTKDVSVTGYREGGQNETEQKSPGLASYSDITLKRGVIVGPGDDDFEAWMNQVHQLGAIGNPGSFRRAVTIILVSNDGRDAFAYDVMNAWPKTETPFEGLNGLASENQFETIVLVHEGFKKRRL